MEKIKFKPEAVSSSSVLSVLLDVEFSTGLTDALGCNCFKIKAFKYHHVLYMGSYCSKWPFGQEEIKPRIKCTKAALGSQGRKGIFQNKALKRVIHPQNDGTIQISAESVLLS